MVPRPEEMRAVAAKPKRAAKKTARGLARLVVEDLNDAQRSVSTEERANYKDAQQSVVDARRNAVRHEGLLRIN